jgi:hypothetical protein
MQKLPFPARLKRAARLRFRSRVHPPIAACAHLRLAGTPETAGGETARIRTKRAQPRLGSPMPGLVRKQLRHGTVGMRFASSGSVQRHLLPRSCAMTKTCWIAVAAAFGVTLTGCSGSVRSDPATGPQTGDAASSRSSSATNSSTDQTRRADASAPLPPDASSSSSSPPPETLSHEGGAGKCARDAEGRSVGNCSDQSADAPPPAESTTGSPPPNSAATGTPAECSDAALKSRLDICDPAAKDPPRNQ